MVRKKPLRIKKKRKHEYKLFKSKLSLIKYSKIKYKIMDENIIQFLISLAKVAPMKIPSNWKANIEIKGVMTTNPHNSFVRFLKIVISVNSAIM